MRRRLALLQPRQVRARAEQRVGDVAQRAAKRAPRQTRVGLDALRRVESPLVVAASALELHLERGGLALEALQRVTTHQRVRVDAREGGQERRAPRGGGVQARGGASECASPTGVSPPAATAAATAAAPGGPETGADPMAQLRNQPVEHPTAGGALCSSRSLCVAGAHATPRRGGGDATHRRNEAAAARARALCLGAAICHGASAAEASA